MALQFCSLSITAVFILLHGKRVNQKEQFKDMQSMGRIWPSFAVLKIQEAKWEAIHLGFQAVCGWQAARKLGLHPYNHKELNASSNRTEVGSTFFLSLQVRTHFDQNLCFNLLWLQIEKPVSPTCISDLKLINECCVTS